MVISFRAGCGFAVRPVVHIPYPRGLGSLTVCNRHERPYATGRLEDSGRQSDEKMLRETMHSRSCATFFCHSAVLGLPAVLLRKVSIVACTKNQEHRGRLPFTRKTRKFWLENEMIHTVPFDTFQKL